MYAKPLLVFEIIPKPAFSTEIESPLKVDRYIACIAGDSQGIGRGAQTIYPYILLLDGGVPFFGTTCEIFSFTV